MGLPFVSSSNWTPSDLHLRVAANINSIAKVMGKFDNGFRFRPISTAPRLAAVSSRKEALETQLESAFPGNGLRLIQPAGVTWERIEATISDEWLDIWPGRNKCREERWFVYEFAQIREDLRCKLC